MLKPAGLAGSSSASVKTRPRHASGALAKVAFSWLESVYRFTDGEGAAISISSSGNSQDSMILRCIFVSPWNSTFCVPRSTRR